MTTSGGIGEVADGRGEGAWEFRFERRGPGEPRLPVPDLMPMR